MVIILAEDPKFDQPFLSIHTTSKDLLEILAGPGVAHYARTPTVDS